MNLLILAGLAVLAWRWLVAKPKPGIGAIARARTLLGVPAGADAAEIRTAHRRLVARVHPDAGGSAEQAQAANEARDLLLAQLSRRASDRA